MVSTMSGADRLLSGRSPPVGSIGRESAWGRVGPMAPGYATRGHKRVYSGGAGGMMDRLKQQMRSAPSESPESRMTNTMMENDWITVPRKVARNPDLASQQSKLDHFMVFIHPAVDEYDVETDVGPDYGRDAYRSHFLASTQEGYTRTIPRDKISDTRYTPVGGGSTAYLSFEVSLSEMNHLLQCQEKRVIDRLKGDRNFVEVMDEWAFGGIQVTSKQNETKYGIPYHTGDDAHTTSVVWGMAFTANYWGKAARRGQRLYLIAKRVERDPPLGSKSYIPIASEGDQPYKLGILDPREVYGLTEEQARSQGLVAKPFQIIPWPSPDMVEPGDYPPYEDRVYIDNNGEERLAHVIPVGLSYEPRSKLVSSDLFDRATWDDTAVNKLPRVTVMLGA